MIKILKGLLINSFYLYLIQGINYLLPLLVLPYLLKVLSGTAFGIFTYSQALVQLLIVVVDFGFNLTITKKIASLPEGSPEIISIYWLVTLIKTFFFVVLAFGVVVFFYAVPGLEIYRTAVFWSLSTLAGVVLFPVWLFQGLGRMKAMSVINAVAKLFTFPLIFVFVTTRSDYLPAVLVHSGAYVLAGLLAVAVVLSEPRYRKIPISSLNVPGFLSEIKYSWPVFLSNSAVSLYTSSLTIILGSFASAAQVGLFGAIERIIRVVCFGVYLPINQAAFPVIAKYAVSDFPTAKRLFRILFFAVLAIMLTICMVFLFIDSWIIREFFSDFTEIRSTMRLAIFTVVPIALGAVCGQLGLLGMGSEVHKKAFSNTYIVIGLISVPFSIVCIKLFLVNGTVLSMALTELAICIGMFYHVKKYQLL